MLLYHKKVWTQAVYVEENVHVWESTERPLLTCFFTCTSFYSMFNFQLWKVTKHALFNTLPCLQVWHRECKSPPHLGTSLLSKSVPFWESSCMSAAAAAKKKKSHNTAVQKRPSHFCIVLFWKKINNTHLERNMISNTTAERARHPWYPRYPWRRLCPGRGGEWRVHRTVYLFI